MEDMNAQYQRLNTENVDIKRRLDKLEDSDYRHDENIKQLYAHQEGTKVYVNQILQKLESLETKLFTALTTNVRNNQRERKDWQELLKYVIGATIGIIILYLFQQGGIK